MQAAAAKKYDTDSAAGDKQKRQTYAAERKRRLSAFAALGRALAGLEANVWANTLNSPGNLRSDPWYGFERDVATARANYINTTTGWGALHDQAIQSAYESL